jgi:hypothetical protein
LANDMISVFVKGKVEDKFFSHVCRLFMHQK